MKFETKYEFGQILYLKTDKEQLPRMFVGIQFSPEGVLYKLAHIETESWHYEMEFSKEQNILTMVN